uniref:Uncharacterized protein n=1 Tax=Mycena chlorophos TaxID=658473 RepID=A0ABQ0M8N2_MYCCL|nr:predicted protein [Mycena chlorophos]
MPTPFSVLARSFTLVECAEWAIRLYYPQSAVHHLLRRTLTLAYTAGLYGLVAFDLVAIFVNFGLAPIVECLLDAPVHSRSRGVRPKVPPWQLCAVFGGLPVVVGSILREQGSETIPGTYVVLKDAVVPLLRCLGVAILAAFVVFVPLLVVWVVSRRLTVKPYKRKWSRRTSSALRLTSNAFFALLAFEWMHSKHPQQTDLASVLNTSKWIGLAAYVGAAIWFFSDRAATFFLRKALAILKLPPTPVKSFNTLPPDLSHHWVQFVFFPMAVVLNAYVYTGTSTIAGVAWTIGALGASTVLAFYIVLLDILIYRLFCDFLPVPSAEYSTTDIMAIHLAQFCLRDAEGKTGWERRGYRSQIGVWVETSEGGFGVGRWRIMARFSVSRSRRTVKQ